MSKDRKNLLVFGYGLGIISVIFGIGGLIKHGLGFFQIVLLFCSIIFISVTSFNPTALRPGYRLWMKVAHLIGGVVTAVVLIVNFILIFTPVALVLRITGRDHLQRDFSRKNKTYWVKREPIVFHKERYHQQF